MLCTVPGMYCAVLALLHLSTRIDSGVRLSVQNLPTSSLIDQNVRSVILQDMSSVTQPGGTAKLLPEDHLTTQIGKLFTYVQQMSSRSRWQETTLAITLRIKHL